MPAKTSARSRLQVEPAAGPAQLRNIAVVGHAGVGKTTLVEHLLARAGAIARAGTVADGTTLSDADPVEIEQQRSAFLSACPLRYRDVVVTLLDAPGAPEFVCELRAGLRAADAAMFVVSATDDIDETTLALWEECAAVGVPRAVVVNRLDAPRADLDRTQEGLRTAFGGIDGNAVLPRYVRVGGELRDLLSSDSPAQEEARNTLIEAIISESEDETLLERYLDGEALDLAVLVEDLHRAVANGHFHPVIPIDAATGFGLPELLQLLVDGFPSPLEAAPLRTTTPDGAPGPELRCDADGPLAAEVVRTWIDPYLGRASLVRVFSGTLRAEGALHVSGHGGGARGHPDHDSDEKSASLLGPSLEPIEAAKAGELCVMTRLASAETGDTVSARTQPLLLQTWAVPEPTLPVAIHAATRNDEDALAKGLARLSASDPALRIERNTATGQLLLWCVGEAHSDVVLAQLRGGGCRIETEPVKVALLATFAGPARGHGRQVKQSGGHGQFAVCDVHIEPLPRGAGVEFVDRVVGGAVPREYISSVEKGVRSQLADGVSWQAPIIDVRVTLLDGKAHSVDSSDAAFQLAGALAVKDAAAQATLQLLEPIEAVDIVVGDERIGAVLSDLSGRRGRVTGSEPAPSNRPGARTVVHAEVPAIELSRYAVTLRSITGGSGSFTRTPLRHEPADTARFWPADAG